MTDPEAPAALEEVNDRGAAGTLGGWFESSRDVTGKWVFLKEVSVTQTIPKMDWCSVEHDAVKNLAPLLEDHLACFLPGTLALDVFHYATEHFGPRAVQPHLLEKGVHMYFRTSSDLAPEIVRFNARGLLDDQGSTHNILRPETVESLYMMWRTTKLQIYRNWGQRLLSAFYRLKTPYGFGGLHNVNRPSSKRDDMPSFFMAETLKYLFLLFSSDSALPLDHFVLNTEAPDDMCYVLGSGFPLASGIGRGSNYSSWPESSHPS
ncbi:2-alpha-mannosidase (ER alpha-1 [Durusdinium trenchii]|uniref:mannosyl-oligosaccharide 1,2-alpha-mannosidase n=1 Tax=Durusdinium trenchii TaxID=1381693 RepID=A0ABP0R607_9DINO